MSKMFLMESIQGTPRHETGKQVIDHMIRTGQPCLSQEMYGLPASLLSTLWYIQKGGLQDCPMPSWLLFPQVSFPSFGVPVLALSMSHFHHPLQSFPDSTIQIFITLPQTLSGPHPTQAMIALPKSAVQSNVLKISERHPRVWRIPNPLPPKSSSW